MFIFNLDSEVEPLPHPWARALEGKRLESLVVQLAFGGGQPSAGETRRLPGKAALSGLASSIRGEAGAASPGRFRRGAMATAKPCGAAIPAPLLDTW
jgi:hypothetical protein